MAAEPLLSSKLQIPATRAGGVVRARLLSTLTAGLRLGHRLTLVSAPPGFGKSTLIAQWAETIGRPVAWLTVDEGDNDAGRFLSYVSAALSRVADRLAQRGSGSASAISLQEQVVALVNDLGEAGADVLLVLDDYHAIRTFAVHDLVAFLLANQPSTMHLVIGTREDPPLPVARMRALDQLTEIRERALRFTAEEASAFFSQTMHLDLSLASVGTLTARTEGWIAGLQLAGLALSQATSTDEFVAAFAGDDRYIVDYLMAEVLQRSPERQSQFLRQTSILDRLSGGVCDALTGRRDSQEMLEALESANLFLISLDNRREWYRYHVLFAEVLRLTLTAEEQIELHKKAAAWFQSRGLEQMATHHARLAAQMSARTASRRQGQAPPHSQLLVEPLSEREIEVLSLIAAGLSNREIADRLVIAPGTVKRHTNNIYSKLQVRSRTQAIALARDLNLL